MYSKCVKCPNLHGQKDRRFNKLNGALQTAFRRLSMGQPTGVKIVIITHHEAE